MNLMLKEIKHRTIISFTHKNNKHFTKCSCKLNKFMILYIHRNLFYKGTDMLKRKIKKKLSYARVIVIGILISILIGTLLLMLPIATRSGESAGFTTSLFTATSAVCVTGLVLEDTYLFWSLFGQIVIILLIQIGGLGFMTFITLFSFFVGRQIGLRERRLIMESSGIMELGSVMSLLKRIIFGTLAIEGCGAFLLTFRFCADFGFWQGIYCSVFHSISAFCNAGFDLMGRYGAFSSLTPYSDDIYVNLVIMALIFLGGIGFIVWNDFLTYKFNFKRYRVHSKIVLTTSLVLIVLGAVLFFVFEYDASLAGKPMYEKIIASLFQSMTPRTAGFATVDNSKFSNAGALMTIFLMLVGGSSGSTAGGMKTGTLAILVLGMFASASRKKDIVVFRRRIDGDSVRQASSIAFIYVSIVVISSCAICAIDGLPLKEVLFETSSAIGTVGSSMSMTPLLSTVSRYILIFMMFGGRAGGLTLALVLAERNKIVPVEHPAEKILIG